MRTGAPRTSDTPRVAGGADVEREVAERVVEACSASGRAAGEIVRETLYHEGRRLSSTGAEPDPFFQELRRDLLAAANAPDTARALLDRVARRYASEIGGHFDPRVYALATRLLPRGLGVLLHGAETSSFMDALGNVDDRVRFEGDLEGLRSATTHGTVVLVPTHVSNLDSPLLGWSIFRLGLPPFAYAAGLNLFTSHVLGFFMRHLGAYTVDRTKHDPLYIETLKEYTTTLLARGQHLLFFPGGTRSRSGALESHLKLGLLGTLPAAFQRRLASGTAHPRIYVVPCTLSYPLVLEASSLVEDFLRAEGGARALDLHDEPVSTDRWVPFARELRSLDLAVTVRFAPPLDPLGNVVDERGASRDGRGHAIDPALYFMERGHLVRDAARDAEYTRGLARRVLGAYRSENVPLATSVLAFAMFESLRARSRHSDVFRTIRGIGPDDVVPTEALLTEVERVLAQLAALASDGRIAAPAELAPTRRAEIVHAALATFATYHTAPVVTRVAHGFASHDASLLYYYRNRLDGYDLERATKGAPS